MRSLAILLLLLCLLHVALSSQLPVTMDPDQDGKVTKEEESKFLEALHGTLDQDKDGSISGKELFGTEERLGDDGFNLEELRNFWMSSSVHGWNAIQVAFWLDAIGMGKYKKAFQQRHITGQILPSLALEEGKFMGTVMGISDEDRQFLVKKILQVVFDYAVEEKSYVIEFILAILACGFGGLAFYMFQNQQKHIQNIQMIEERMKGTQDEAKRTESQFQLKLQEVSTQSEDALSKLKSVEEERHKLVQGRESSEETVKLLKDDLEVERQKKKFVDTWLREKFLAETQTWHKKWTALLRQIESNRESLESLEKRTFVFTRSGKAIEQSRQMEVLESEIEAWRKGYTQFLESWDRLATNGHVIIPDLQEKIAASKRGK